MPTIKELSIFNTKLANQRTYMAYARTSLIIAAIAGTFKNMYVVAIAIFFMVVSTYQYYMIDKNLNENILPGSNFMDMMPLLFLLLSCITLYLQWYKN
jgi:hypothetical protein